MAAVPAFADPSVTSKRAQAQQVMGQLAHLSDSLERARSQYYASTQQLAKIQNDLRVNTHELKLAKHNLKASQRVIAQRLVTLYRSDQASTLEVVLGARSLDDMITRMDSAKSVTSLDARVLSQVKTFRTAVKRNHELLAKARSTQQRVVSQRAAAKVSIESQISQQNSLLSSIKGEIARIVAADAARQRQLAAAAQQRLSLNRVSQAQSQDNVVGATAVAPQSLTVVAPPSSHSGAANAALSMLGTPYVWAGSQPGGFDCSGLVMWAFAQVGVSLPHSTYADYSLGVPVSRDQLQPGDLVFFDGLGHMGIYIGGDQFVHAPHTGDVVKISSLNEGWYSSTYVGARRIL
ncbi:MAG: peptidoglycan DL-endopeptidase CwlO [Gaiellaceae bacterium]|nr:peptidoglycan DL-endopeptidase CwlO [Gaiellaceae bacterium]